LYREPDRRVAFALAIIIITLGAALTIWAVHQEDQQLRSNLLTESRLAVLSLDPAAIGLLAGAPSDLASPDYQYLKARLAAIRASDPDVRFTYLLGQDSHGEIFFYADSEPADSVAYSPPGQVYTEADSSIRNAFLDQEEMTSGPDSDRWGIWVSSIVPVRDPVSGRLIALYGMDIDAKNWNQRLIRAGTPAAFTTLLLLILLFLFSIIYRRSKQEKRQLAISEKAYRTMFEHTGSATVQIEEDSTISRVNGMFEQLTGSRREEVEGKRKLTEFIHPDDRARVEAYHKERRSPSGTAPAQYECRFVIRDGTVKDIVLSAGFIPDTKQTIASLFDITEKKRLERAVWEGREQYRQLFDLANDGITIVQDGIIRTTNAGFAAITGYPVGNLIGMPIRTIVHPGDIALVLERYERRIRGDPDLPSLYTLRLIRRDGAVRWVQLNTTVMNWEGKLATLNITRDVTESKEIEIALRESNTRYQLILQSANDAILIHEMSRQGPGSILEVNEQACRMLGYTRDELLSMNIGDIDVPELREQSAHVLENLFTTGRIVFQTEHLTKDQRRIPVEVSGRLVEIEGKQVVLSIIRDLTLQKRTELVLLEANKKLNLLNSITRHDVLNQLMALKGYIELSLQYLKNPEKLSLYISRELDAANAIEHQITFTRDYQDMGIRAPVWQDVGLQLIHAKGSLPMHDVVLVQEGTGIEVLADPLFEKIFYNLLDNALKYGGDKLKTIHVSTQETPEGLDIVVEDDGIGISDEDRQYLFHRGFGRNTGYGLFLSREILAITGMTITENGAAGRGARFVIHVPCGKYRPKRDGAPS